MDYIFRKGNQESLDILVIISFLTANIKKSRCKTSKMENIFAYRHPKEFYLEQSELGQDLDDII